MPIENKTPDQTPQPMIEMPADIQATVERLRLEKEAAEAQAAADSLARQIANAAQFNANRLPGMEPMDPYAEQPPVVELNATTPLYRPAARFGPRP